MWYDGLATFGIFARGRHRYVRQVLAPRTEYALHYAICRFGVLLVRLAFMEVYANGGADLLVEDDDVVYGHMYSVALY